MNYDVKAHITTIKATSRASIKVHDSYYTVEYGEERVIPDTEDLDIIAERQALWNDVNKEVDDQVESIVNAFK